jgi:hypothetical protein
MTEINSITWSSYDQHKVQIESELRWKIAEVIEQKIDISRTNEILSDYVLGLQLAKAIVLDLDRPESSNLEHPALF